MKILQIVTPQLPVFAHYAVQGKKKNWIVERVPVMFYGLLPMTNGPEGKPNGETTVEPLVYNYQKQGVSVATNYKNFLGLDIMSTPTQIPKDFAKELVLYVAELEKPQVTPAPPAATTTTTPPDGKPEGNQPNTGSNQGGQNANQS